MTHLKCKRLDKLSVSVHKLNNHNQVGNAKVVKAIGRKTELDSCETLVIFKNKH